MSEAFKKYTVVIPTFERGDTVVACVKAILSQHGGESIKILVSDNHSLDGSWEKAESCLNEYENVKLIRNSENLGFQGNFLKILLNFDTDYCITLSDEDSLNLSVLSEIDIYIEAHPDVAFISPRVEDTTGKVYRGVKRISSRTKSSWLDTLFFGSRKVAVMRGQDFMDSSFYFSAMIFKKNPIRQAIEVAGEKRILEKGQVYPQYLVVCALIAAGQPAIWHLGSLSKQSVELPTRIEAAPSTGSYFGLRGRAHQVAIYDSFFTEMLEKSHSAEEKKHWNAFRILRIKRALLEVQAGLRLEYPEDKKYFTPMNLLTARWQRTKRLLSAMFRVR